MSGNWEKNVRTVTPYTPGEQPKDKNVIKLNTNENPYPPSPAVRRILEDRDFSKELRLYPDPTVGKLTDALAGYYGVDPEQVFVGVGSDDVLAMSFLAFFNSEKPILFPDVTYSFYDVWADVFRIPYETVPLRQDFSLDVDGFMRENGGIVIANPNAPTGVFEETFNIERVIRENGDSVVIIDEAYIDFGGESVLPLVEKYDNLLVVQTFSKSRSMAGSRIGFAIGSKKLISCLQNVKYSFNSYTMDRISIELGTASLSDREYFKSTCNKIMETREWSEGELIKLGFNFPTSKANFIFAKHETVPAGDIFRALREAGIFVRYFDKPGINDHLRITIGTRSEMEALFAFLRKYLHKD